MKNIFFPFFFLAAFSIGCGDDDSAATKNRDLLTAHPWKLVSRTANNVPATLAACDLDDVFTYRGDALYQQDFGEERCAAFEVEPLEYIWGFTDETQTRLFYNDTSDVNNVTTVRFCNVSELTETGLTLDCSTGSGPTSQTLVEVFEAE